MKAFTGETVIAKRDVKGDYYHKGCVPTDAQLVRDVKVSDEQDMDDPILLHRACLECGQWLLTGARALAYQDYCEQQVK